ncbi:hypothetical protein J3L18_00005 [Mucilaginibacter gossypii]|uniref:hypothetical protein n=1 Tax=Mucilaginibacter gossypii TaxID=551996 RepID=UPI000DCE0FDD|nr:MULTISPECIES: hypothetical protein [Mucilaginibacter]QTE37485.2 hypothetical protein J3L18_00005 [Mucilaginibacter gossypii]RAV52311.1 hypothetical protein DIU36_24565 [Mucilaginibacter rubeus]
MARTVDTIQAAIITDVQADPILNGSSSTPPFTLSTSKRAVWRLWTRIFATACFILESIIDVFKDNVETTAAKAAAASRLWVQDKMFKFQYDATVPQIIQYIDNVATYNPVDTTKRIITRCSVKTDLSNNVLIKLAQLEPPQALDSSMIASAQGYINTIGTAGIDYRVTSGDPDRLYIDADIYYNGQYAATILQSLTNALNSYLSTQESNEAYHIAFGGAVLMSDIELVLKNVVGVNDVVLNNVKARPNSSAFADSISLVLNNQLVSRLWNTTTGYIILEDTAGETLSDSLNLIVQ